MMGDNPSRALGRIDCAFPFRDACGSRLGPFCLAAQEKTP